MKAVIDFETSIHNRGHVYDPRNFAVSYAVYFETGEVVFKRFNDPDFVSYLRGVVNRLSEYINFQCKFDISWMRRLGVELPSSCKVWDCQLAEFIYSGQQNGFMSLNEALESYALPVKVDGMKEYWAAGISTENVPESLLREYNIGDVSSTWLLYKMQQEVLSDKQKALVYIEGEDLLTLQDAEQNGIKFNAEAAKARSEEIKHEVGSIEQQLMQHISLPDIPGVVFNFDSGDHLSAFLYGGTIVFDYAVGEPAVYKSGDKKGQEYVKNKWHTYTHTFERIFTPLDKTEVKKTVSNSPSQPHFYQVDEPTLRQLPGNKETKALLSLLLERSKKIKVAEMLDSLNNKIIEMNWENNFLHGQYNQNIARTGRLSSSSPNLQNTSPEVDMFIESRYASP